MFLQSANDQTTMTTATANLVTQTNSHVEEPTEKVCRLFLERLQSRINSFKDTLEPDPNIVGVYELQIVSKKSDPLFFIVDLRKGLVHQGKSSIGDKADCCITIGINDFVLLLNGQLNFTKAYLTGRLKVTGNTASAFKFQRFWMDTASIDQTQKVAANKLELPVDGVKSDVIFEIIRNRMAYEPDLVKKMPFVVQVDLTKSDGGQTPSKHVATWTLDTKSQGGRIYRAAAEINGTKPDASIVIDDEDFVSILFNRINPQRLFISGKMKVKGNIMLLQRLNKFWTQIQNSRQDEYLDYPLIRDILLNSRLVPGLESEMMFFVFLKRLVRITEPMPPANCLIRLTITKKQRKQVDWILSYNSFGRLSSIKHILLNYPSQEQQVPVKQADLEMVIDDHDFTRLLLNMDNFDLNKAIQEKRIQLVGDDSLVPILKSAFQLPPVASPSGINLPKAKL